MDSKVLRQIPDRKTGIIRTTHITYRKLAIINNRIVIGEIGMSRIAAPAHVVYEFQPWINRIQHHIPSDISVADFASIIKTETQTIADTLNTNGKDALQGINPAYQMPLEFLIWGYDNLPPVGYSVRLEFHEMKITGPFLAQVHSGISAKLTDIIRRSQPMAAYGPSAWDFGAATGPSCEATSTNNNKEGS